VERRLSAILVADVVGYSRLMELDEVGTIARLETVRRELIDPIVAGHQGRIVKLMGDGALVVFESAVEAVGCAAELQVELAKRSAGTPEPERMVLRIGVNVGDIALVDKDVYGDGVNVAARLEQLCEPGGVLVSGTAYDNLQGKIDFPLDFVGERQVKNIKRPIRVYRLRLDGVRARRPLLQRLPLRTSAIVLLATALLAAVGGWVWLTWEAAPASAKPTVAVLPFNNYGGDDATGRLADGVTEDIITDLARSYAFGVIARNSTEVYKGKATNVTQIATALGVRYVLEGSIQRQAKRIRITAQLIDAKSDVHLWSERWDRPDDDVFAIQSEIAQQVANRMGGSAGVLMQADRESARRKRPGNLSAYELFLLGDEKVQVGDPESLKQAVGLLERAVELDPGLSRAWSTLFQAYDKLAYSGVDPENSRKRAAEAAERAVAVDPSDPDAHVAQAYNFGGHNDLIRAKAELDLALRLAPGSSNIMTHYATWAATFGDPKRGGELADQVIKLDPIFAPWAAKRLAYAYFAADRYPDALHVLDRVALDSYDPDTWMVKASALAVLGRAGEAKFWVDETIKHLPDFTIEGWTNQPGYSDDERRRIFNAMRLAGFPPCAKRGELDKVAKPLRLPECDPATATPR
jgi:TolB-like protein/class 3 adenylate cyclase